MTRRLRPALAALHAALLVGGCTFDATVIAPPAPRLLVHGVLNPAADTLEILVEESLTGRVTIDTTRRYDPADPIASAGGIPVHDARVSVIRETAPGDSVVLVERLTTSTTGTRGTGVYRIATTRAPGSAGTRLDVAPGATYRLHIVTLDGREVRGRTRVPGPIPGWSADEAMRPVAVAMDRTRDTLRLDWASIAGARTAGVRVDTPRGPWFLFNDSTSFAFAGSLRNFFQPGLPSVFHPGWVQNVSVAVVDTGFFDYYRSGNDPFGGSRVISRLDGAIGLFGAAVPVLRRLAVVSQPAAAPLDAWWAAGTDSLALWLESPGPSVSSISGWSTLNVGDEIPVAGVGTLRGADVRFVLVRGARDTVGVFAGTLGGETLDGVWQAGPGRLVSGPRTYRRAGPPRPPLPR